VREYITLARIFLLAATSAAVPFRAADVLASMACETPSERTLELKRGSAERAQRPPESLIHVEIIGLRNDKGQVRCAIYLSARRISKEGR
jgi:hypothetical protein